MRRDDVGRGFLIRLVIAGVAMMNVLRFSVAIWYGIYETTRGLFQLICAAMSLPAVLYCGQPLFSNARRALRVGALNMDVLIVLAILMAADMSLYEVLNGGHHAYFDAAFSLTFFLLIGRFLDHRTRSSVHSAAKELAALEVQTAHRIGANGADKIGVSALAIGNTILIPSGGGQWMARWTVPRRNPTDPFWPENPPPFHCRQVISCRRGGNQPWCSL